MDHGTVSYLLRPGRWLSTSAGHVMWVLEFLEFLQPPETPPMFSHPFSSPPEGDVQVRLQISQRMDPSVLTKTGEKRALLVENNSCRSDPHSKQVAAISDLSQEMQSGDPQDETELRTQPSHPIPLQVNDLIQKHYSR